MIILIITIVLCVGLFIYDATRDDDTAYFLAPATILIILLFVNGLGYFGDICCLKRYNSDIEIEKLLISQRDDILQSIKTEASKYIAYEQSTFENLKPENAQILLANYPQLNSSWIIKDNIDKIAFYNSKIFECREDKAKTRQEILSNRYNIFMFYQFNLDY